MRDVADVVRLVRKASSGRVLAGVPLANLGSWRIGGPADVLVEPESVGDVQRLCCSLGQEQVPYVVLGAGSNLLFADAGFRGVVIRIGRAFSGLTVAPTGLVTAGAGLWVPRFVRQLTSAGLRGCGHAIGIPGQLGGLIIMNGGSQQRAIGDQLVEVRVVTRAGRLKSLTRDECRFEYRRSALQDSGFVVVEATFQYEKGDPTALRREALTLLRDRRHKFPLRMPNCGSVFLSDPRLHDCLGSPGKAIEEVGLKGKRRGDAVISSVHANFIVNIGRASAMDVLCLIHDARRAVEARSGVSMKCEVRYLHPNGRICPAHEAAEELCETGQDW